MPFKITNAEDIKITKTDRLLVEAVKDVHAHGKIGMISGIKGSGMTPDLLDDGTEFKSGDFTGTTGGGVEVKDVTVTNALFTLEESYQVSKLASTIYKLAMKQGVNPEDFPIEDAVLDIKKNAINRQYDKAIFLGDSTGTGKTLADFVDGLIKKIKASATVGGAGAVVKSSVAPTALSASNALAKVKAFCDKYLDTFNGDGGVRDLTTEDLTVYVSPANFRTWYTAVYGTAGLINANTLNGGKLPTEAVHPAYDGNIKVAAQRGMTGSNEMFMGQPANFNEIVDGDAENDFMTLHFSKDKEAFLLHVAMRLGTAIIRPQEVLVQMT